MKNLLGKKSYFKKSRRVLWILYMIPVWIVVCLWCGLLVILDTMGNTIKVHWEEDW